MILLLDTSTPVCRLSLVMLSGRGDASNITTASPEVRWRSDTEWDAGRALAKGLLGFMQAQLQANGKDWADISGLVAFKGPGSFTGLRIGITVLNSLAYARELPIVGQAGDSWQQDGLARLASGDSDAVVLPEYGGEANITKPRK